MNDEFQDILDRLRLEFIDSTKDRLDAIDLAIDQIYRGEGNREDLVVSFRRNVHSLKGVAGSYGFGFVSIVAHRLEDYLESTRRLEQDQWLDTQKFIDQIRSVIEAGEEPDAAGQDAILTDLPRSAVAAEESAVSRELTALIVMPPGVQRKAVSNRLTDHGFSVSFADDPAQSVGVSLTLKPDLILSNQEFPKVTGYELANMLAAAKITQEIPFGLMTSHDDIGAGDTAHPDQLRIIKKDQGFLGSVSAYLKDIGLAA